MHKFRNDYSEIAHEEVLKALIKYQDEQNVGYGLDPHTKRAEELVKKIFDAPTADVHFLMGGTQTNMTFISYVLKDYEAVVCASSGHINVHEAGSIEATGHKILYTKAINGKIDLEELEKIIIKHQDEHMVKPRLVYISNSTETGTIYQRSELEKISKICKDHNLLLFIDGARLACALVSSANDVKASDIAKYADAFYLGGTKNGLLFGEALVIVNKDLQNDFRRQIKNKGGLLAKGFISGIQFETILEDDLYLNMAANANNCAKALYDKLVKLGFNPDPVYTNQVFLEVDSTLANKIIESFGCEEWDVKDKTTVVRFVTSFKTKLEDVDEVYNYLLNNK